MRLDIGSDLESALAELGQPVSAEPARRRIERATATRARDAAREAAAAWPEPWAPDWIDDVIRAGGLRGLDEAQARDLVESVRSVLGVLDPGAATPVSRVELAARLLGSAHALDPGTRLEAATTRALRHRTGPAASRELWEQAGAHLDLTSGPALIWRLPLLASCELTPITESATTLGLPLHLSRFALERHPVQVEAGVGILVVENPRLVEAAAQANSPQSVIAANGNPSGAVQLLLHQLLEAGASLRYHGDFDAAGLAMCARMAQSGLRPWRMDASDYLEALASADASGVDLPRDADVAGPTPWDRQLQEEFDRDRRIIHEERLLPALLSG